MIEWMVEAEDANIARPVDDIKKIKVFTLLRTEGQSEREQGFRPFRSFRAQGMGRCKAAKTLTPTQVSNGLDPDNRSSGS